MESEEPMDVDAGEFDELLEEGEYVESNRVSRKPLASVVALPLPENRIENKGQCFVTGIDIFGKEAQEKLEERAKRFGTKHDAERSTIKEAANLYESFGIIEGTDQATEYRLNVIHMRGTENMNTKDIFKYFEDYAPASIEWINDISCNIVWLDKASAARALIGLSKKIVGIKKSKKYSDDESEEDSDDDVIINGSRHVKEENSIHVKDIRCPIPIGIWRKGRDYKDARNIFLRFATLLDRKMHPAEKKGLKGILTNSRKRTMRQIKEPSPPVTQSTNGIAAKNPWGSLSKNWGVTDFVEDDYLPKAPPEPVGNVKGRLGYKPHNRDDDYEDEDDELEESTVIELSDDSQASESSSEEDDWCRRSKLPRMRMHADDEEEKIQKRKGKIRNLVNHTARINDVDLRLTDNLRGSNDLRGKLVAKRRLPPRPAVFKEEVKPIYKEDIQVVLTNNPKVLQGDFKNIDVTEDEYEDEDDIPVKATRRIIDDEEEEGEIIDSDSDSRVEGEDEEEDEGDVEIVEEEEDNEDDYEEEGVEDGTESGTESSSSSVSEKEIQGPKGSVIKVVPRKPKLQSTVSTVWARLNNTKNDRSDDSSPERNRSKADLRHTLRKNDLRSRIGNHHMRGRSPLRIELRNDRYTGRRSESE